MAPIMHKIQEWLFENEKFFQPPICNKLMYKDGQLKVFFVGGPNIRKDFHIEAGEEFFYMLKGDMNLITVEQGNFKDNVIKEGEVFLLPPRIPHSPQRKPNTVGLVIERERYAEEKDCLRYYVENSTEILYEKWFQCYSLDSQFPALIKEFFASEQYKTGKPIPGSILDDRPLQQDHNRLTSSPFSLKKWLQLHKKEIQDHNKMPLFQGDYVSRVTILGNGEHGEEEDVPETFLWQLEGDGRISTEGEVYELEKDTTVLIPEGETWNLTNEDEAVTLSVVMNPLPDDNKERN